LGVASGGWGCLPLCNFWGGELGEHVFQQKIASFNEIRKLKEEEE